MGMAGGAALGTPLLSAGRAIAGEPMAQAVAAGAAETPANSAGSTRWARSAAKKREQTRGVVWTTHEPIDFLLRRGDHDDDLQEHYATMLSEDNIQRTQGSSGGGSSSIRDSAWNTNGRQWSSRRRPPT